jgi:hypothetical protein
VTARWDETTGDKDQADVDDGGWIDEDVGMDGVTGDLLQLEFHTDYAGNPEKRPKVEAPPVGSPASCCKFLPYYVGPVIV